MSKIIVTDVDGVLLDWINPFDEWMTNRGYEQVIHHTKYNQIKLRYVIGIQESYDAVDEFNEGPLSGLLEPHLDAVHGVRRLVEEGYRFFAVTAFGSCDKRQAKRADNLARVFGDNVFEEVHCTPAGGTKTTHLAELIDRFPDAVWLEDNPKHAKEGQEMGYRTFLFDQPYNPATGLDRVTDWAHLHEKLGI